MKRYKCDLTGNEVNKDNCKNCMEKQTKVIPLKICAHKKTEYVCESCGHTSDAVESTHQTQLKKLNPT